MAFFVALALSFVANSPAPRAGDPGTAPDLQCYWVYWHPFRGVVRCPDQTVPWLATDICR